MYNPATKFVVTCNNEKYQFQDESAVILFLTRQEITQKQIVNSLRFLSRLNEGTIHYEPSNIGLHKCLNS